MTPIGVKGLTRLSLDVCNSGGLVVYFLVFVTQRFADTVTTFLQPQVPISKFLGGFFYSNGLCRCGFESPISTFPSLVANCLEPNVYADMSLNSPRVCFSISFNQPY